jgi:recombination protein RecA|nr:MAG TPA: LAGLIDADG DNA endonuclease family [Caudoviricetes sp.]
MFVNNIALSQDEQQIIYGGLLGDATLRKNQNSIRFCQSIKQEEYLKWKYSFFNDNVSEITIQNYQQGWTTIAFSLQNHHHILDQFYRRIRKIVTDKNGDKKITREYLNLLNPLGLAIWWMDDGCLSIHKGNRYGKLCTHGFSYEENLIIQQYFQEIWGIHVDIKIEKRKYYFCRLNTENLKKLISIIYPYVTQVPSMIYKIDLNYTLTKYIGDFKEVYDYIKEKCS